MFGADADATVAVATGTGNVESAYPWPIIHLTVRSQVQLAGYTYKSLCGNVVTTTITLAGGFDVEKSQRPGTLIRSRAWRTDVTRPQRDLTTQIDPHDPAGN